MARLIVVSNRVAIPKRGGILAGGLAVSIRSILKSGPSLWFGWSGRVSSAKDMSTKSLEHGGISYAVTDLVKEDYNEYKMGKGKKL